MNKIMQFIDSKTAYILILPAVLLILLFSIIPIFESLRYAFYDFQLNDQAKSGLYTSGNYNMTLYDETFDYIRYFLDIEESIVTKDASIAQIEIGRAHV